MKPFTVRFPLESLIGTNDFPGGDPHIKSMIRNYLNKGCKIININLDENDIVSITISKVLN